jgi:uncharacterized YigZ family protein
MRYPIPVPGQVELIVKKSRFICSLRSAATVEAAKAHVAEVSAAHADASHNCWAYKVGAPSDSSRLGCSDDGEPRGTAGKPMLTILTHANLGDVVVVVTRYFGGTKLGTGGLVKAYGDSVKLALDQLEVTPKVITKTIHLATPYKLVDPLKRGFPEYEAEIIAENYSDNVAFEVSVPLDRSPDFESWIEGLYGCKIVNERSP